MKSRQWIAMFAVAALLSGSAVLAADDVSARAGARSASLKAVGDTATVGSDVSVANRDRPYMAPPVRDRKPGAREKKRQPNPLYSDAPVCVDNPLFERVSSFFGFTDVSMECRDSNRR